MKKIAGISGLASQLTIIGVLLVVVNKSPWFIWTQDFLSDFGYRGSMTGLYNWGLILTGVLSAVFVYGLRKNLTLNRTGLRGLTSLFTGSVAISVSGVLDKSMDIPHDISSSGSLILIITGMLLTGASLIHSPMLKLGFFSVTAGTIPIILWLIPWQWPGDAIPQVFYFAAWSAWVFIFSMTLLRMPGTVPDEKSSLELSYTH